MSTTVRLSDTFVEHLNILRLINLMQRKQQKNKQFYGHTLIQTYEYSLVHICVYIFCMNMWKAHNECSCEEEKLD